MPTPQGDVPIGLVMFTVATPILAIMVIFAMWFAARAYQARMRLAANGEYQALAERTAAAQAETAASLSIVKAQLADIAASLAAVEKILKQVG
jgi:Tfp pilus assembly protein PilO